MPDDLASDAEVFVIEPMPVEILPDVKPAPDPRYDGKGELIRLDEKGNVIEQTAVEPLIVTVTADREADKEATATVITMQARDEVFGVQELRFTETDDGVEIFSDGRRIILGNTIIPSVIAALQAHKIP